MSCSVKRCVIEGDDGIELAFAQVIEGGIQSGLDLLLLAAQIGGQSNVKDQIGMSGAGDHAEIVDGKPGIADSEDAGDQIATR